MSASAARLSKWAFDNKQFDPDWYAESFPDVGMLDMDPATHYRRYGSVMGRAPNAALADAPEQIAALCLPAPKPGRELLAAHEIALTGAHTRAIHYAQQHLPTERAYTVEVLRANQAVAQGDMASWLKHLNNYLTHFDIAPLQLEGEGDNILSRLATAPLPPVTGGPLISVIMPAWNAEKTIAYAINSILQQSWQNFELLIVDDASEDKTWSIIQDFAARDSRIRAFRNPVNVGPYVSKNVAVTQAKGEWITGHDADDWAHPERLEKHIKIIRSSGNAIKASVSRMIRVTPEGKFMIGWARTNGWSADGVARIASISCMLEKGVLADTLGFWDSVRVGADSELISRVTFLLGESFKTVEQVGMLCLDIESSLSNDKVFGVNRTGAVNHPRTIYRDSWISQHKKLTVNDTLYLEFPPRSYRYDVPSEIAISSDDIAQCIFESQR